MNSMKLRMLAMGSIFIVLSAVLIVRRYSPDDFILTILGIILLIVGIIYKNSGKTKKVAHQTDVSQA